MTEPVTDERFVQLYAEFRAKLPDAIALELAPYPRLFAGKDFHIAAMLFEEVAQDALRQLANGINEFGRYLQQLDAWRSIYTGLSKDERFNLLHEHIKPLAVLCLNAPYAIRGRMTYATCATAYHAGGFVQWENGRPEWSGEHSSWTKAEQLAKPWSAWPALGQALTAMNHEEFTNATSNFRNNHQHGQPRSIETGYIAAIERVPDEPNSWSFGQYEPLAIEELIAPLAKEHALALAAFKAFLALIEQQAEAAPKPEG